MPYKNAEDKRSRSRKRKREHKEKRLCVYCSLPALKGYVSCEKHLKANRISGLKHYAKAIFNYTCKNCGKSTLGEGIFHRHPICIECREKNREYKKKKREEWRKTGRCVSCARLLGTEIYEKDKTCSVCATYRQIGSMRTPKYSQYSIAIFQRKAKAAIKGKR